MGQTGRQTKCTGYHALNVKVIYASCCNAVRTSITARSAHDRHCAMIGGDIDWYIAGVRVETV